MGWPGFQSKAVLEARLGRPVELFSFPYGDDGGDPGIIRPLLAANGYRAACLYGGGPIGVPVGDSYRLSRVAMGPETDLRAALHPDLPVPPP